MGGTFNRFELNGPPIAFYVVLSEQITHADAVSNDATLALMEGITEDSEGHSTQGAIRLNFRDGTYRLIDAHTEDIREGFQRRAPVNLLNVQAQKSIRVRQIHKSN